MTEFWNVQLICVHKEFYMKGILQVLCLCHLQNYSVCYSLATPFAIIYRLENVIKRNLLRYQHLQECVCVKFFSFSPGISVKKRQTRTYQTQKKKVLNTRRMKLSQLKEKKKHEPQTKTVASCFPSFADKEKDNFPETWDVGVRRGRVRGQ